MRKLENSSGGSRPYGKTSTVPPTRQTRGVPAGFSLVELVVTLAILLSVSAIVLTLMAQMMRTEGTVSNRTEMHSGVRSATQVLQQEISQAGRATLPTAVTLSSAVTGAGSSMPTVSSSTGMFVNEQLVIDTGPNQETVALLGRRHRDDHSGFRQRPRGRSSRYSGRSLPQRDCSTHRGSRKFHERFGWQRFEVVWRHQR